MVEEGVVAAICETMSLNSGEEELVQIAMAVFGTMASSQCNEFLDAVIQVDRYIKYACRLEFKFCAFCLTRTYIDQKYIFAWNNSPKYRMKLKNVLTKKT